MQTNQEVNPHPRIVSCVNMWSVFFFFFFLCCHLLNVGACIYATSPGKAKWSGPHRIIKMLHFVLFHSVTFYTKSIVSHIHVNTTKIRNITCTLVATSVILRSLECMCHHKISVSFLKPTWLEVCLNLIYVFDITPMYGVNKIPLSLKYLRRIGSKTSQCHLDVSVLLEDYMVIFSVRLDSAMFERVQHNIQIITKHCPTLVHL